MNLPAKTPLTDSLLSPKTNWRGIPDDLADDAREYLRKSHAPGTKRNYEVIIRQWIDFCGSRSRAFPAKPQKIVEYIAKLAKDGLSPMTIRNRVIVLATVHRTNGWRPVWDYQINCILRAIARERGSRRNRKRPIRHEHRIKFDKALKRDRDRLRAARDRSILWSGFCGALRRSEIASMTLEQIEFTAEGLIYTLPSSKGDPFGNSQTVHIRADPRLEFCPVNALETWLRMSGISDGPIYRELTVHGRLGERPISADAVGDIVVKYAELIGLKSKFYGGHSLRRGWASYAFATGSSLNAIQRHLRHASAKYTRDYIDGPSPTDMNLSRKAGA
jgi:integrase